mgnify:CR=1 FL=1
MRFIHFIIVLFSALSFSCVSFANPIAKPIAQPIKNHTPQGGIKAWSFAEPLKIDNLNISGIVKTDDFMALASDEGNQIEIFKQDSKGLWQSHDLVTLSNNIDEIDLEALAWQKPYLYALGSHSAKRKKVKSSLSQKENIKRLEKIHLEPARQKLFRIELNNKAKAVDIQSMSLSSELASHPILKSFVGIPSKENGIDIEGSAVTPKGKILIGFRGPILRGNAVPVLKIKLDKKDFKIKSTKTLYLHLNGSGIRGISEMPNGYLVLSGAVGDQPLPYNIYRWDGKNQLLGSNQQPNNLKMLCELPSSIGKPEGIQFIQEQQNSIEFIIVEDGLQNGQPTSYHCSKK